MNRIFNILLKLSSFFLVTLWFLNTANCQVQTNYREQEMFSKYVVSKAKIAGWTILAIGAFSDGAVEGFEFDDRRSFERKWGVDPVSFWGSESWRMVYKENNPAFGYKSWLHKQVGAVDFYHVADDVRKTFYISGGIVVGISANKQNQKFHHYIYDVAISFAITSLVKNAAMRWVRS